MIGRGGRRAGAQAEGVPLWRKLRGDLSTASHYKKNDWDKFPRPRPVLRIRNLELVAR